MFYYGYSGKRFHRSYLTTTLEILSSPTIQKTLGLNFYNDYKGSGFRRYIDECFCLIFSDKIGARKIKSYKDFDPLDLDDSYSFLMSDYEDEWRLLGEVPTSFLVGIGLPINQLRIYDWDSYPTAKKELQRILKIASERKLDIVDSRKIKQYEEVKKTSQERICDLDLIKSLDGPVGSTYFYHGIGEKENFIDNFLRVLVTESIKSKRLLNRPSGGCNGLDYVSICKKYPEHFYQDEVWYTFYKKEELSGFYGYVFNHFCFIISDSVSAIKVGISDELTNDLDKPLDLKSSDMFDEWQVKDQIPLSKVIGVGIPLKWLEENKDIISSVDYQKISKAVLLARDLGLDIVDSSNPSFVEEYERQKQESSSKVYQISISLEGE